VNIGSTYCDIDDRTDILYFKNLDKFLIKKEVELVENKVVRNDNHNCDNNSGNADHDADNDDDCKNNDYLKDHDNTDNNHDNNDYNSDENFKANKNDCNDDQLQSFRDLCPLTRTLIRSVHMLT
jgi:hypothetical protein